MSPKIHHENYQNVVDQYELSRMIHGWELFTRFALLIGLVMALLTRFERLIMVCSRASCENL